MSDAAPNLQELARAVAGKYDSDAAFEILISGLESDVVFMKKAWRRMFEFMEDFEQPEQLGAETTIDV